MMSDWLHGIGPSILLATEKEHIRSTPWVQKLTSQVLGEAEAQFHDQTLQKRFASGEVLNNATWLWNLPPTWAGRKWEPHKRWFFAGKAFGWTVMHKRERERHTDEYGIGLQTSCQKGHDKHDWRFETMPRQSEGSSDIHSKIAKGLGASVSRFCPLGGARGQFPLYGDSLVWAELKGSPQGTITVAI